VVSQFPPAAAEVLVEDVEGEEEEKKKEKPEGVEDEGDRGGRYSAEVAYRTRRDSTPGPLGRCPGGAPSPLCPVAQPQAVSGRGRVCRFVES
jgi:hypothetical protein